MSIHDFHSKLTSGNEEGMLFEALRRLKSIGGPALAADEEFGWSHWTEEGTSNPGAAPGWTHWEEEAGLRA